MIYLNYILFSHSVKNSSDPDSVSSGFGLRFSDFWLDPDSIEYGSETLGNSKPT